MARKWYVVRHIDEKFSVQDKPEGVGILLNVDFDSTSEREANMVCAAANAAAEIERDPACIQ